MNTMDYLIEHDGRMMDVIRNGGYNKEDLQRAGFYLSGRLDYLLILREQGHREVNNAIDYTQMMYRNIVGLVAFESED